MSAADYRYLLTVHRVGYFCICNWVNLGKAERRAELSVQTIGEATVHATFHRHGKVKSLEEPIESTSDTTCSTHHYMLFSLLEDLKSMLCLVLARQGLSDRHPTHPCRDQERRLVFDPSCAHSLLMIP